MDAMARMKELVGLLTRAGKAYYQEDREIMSNLEYDKLYDELQKLEKETGVTPVSYTHLDVYKRQGYVRGDLLQ